MSEPNVQRDHDPGVEHATLGHEPVTANATKIVLVGLSVLLLVVAALALMFWLALLFAGLGGVGSERPQRPTSPLAVKHRVPSPRVDPNQEFEREQQEIRKEQVLKSYGWVDRERNIARIPIEEAIKITAERGLAPWQSAEKESSDQETTHEQ